MRQGNVKAISQGKQSNWPSICNITK